MYLPYEVQIDFVVRRFRRFVDEFTLPPIIMVQLKTANLETRVIFQAFIFHFHSYGRKGTIFGFHPSFGRLQLTLCEARGGAAAGSLVVGVPGLGLFELSSNWIWSQD